MGYQPWCVMLLQGWWPMLQLGRFNQAWRNMHFQGKFRIGHTIRFQTWHVRLPQRYIPMFNRDWFKHNNYWTSRLLFPNFRTKLTNQYLKFSQKKSNRPWVWISWVTLLRFPIHWLCNTPLKTRWSHQMFTRKLIITYSYCSGTVPSGWSSRQWFIQTIFNHHVQPGRYASWLQLRLALWLETCKTSQNGSIIFSRRWFT